MTIENSLKASRFKFVCNIVMIISIAIMVSANNHSLTSLAAAKGVTVTISKESQVIPSKSSRSGVDLVRDGKILYKIKVKAVFKHNGKPVKGEKVSFSDPDTSRVVRVSKTSKTDNNGAAYIWYEVRGQVNFKVKASMNTSSYHGSKTSTITCSKNAKYNHTFRVTFYYIPKEGDNEFTGERISVSGISSRYKFKKDFIKKVKNAGSGYSTHGFYIHYDGNNTFSKSSSKPKTASGTTPTEDRTIAANNFTIPRKFIDNTWQRGCVKISNHSAYYRNEDNGGDFDENKSSELYNIDIFAGVGKVKLSKLMNEYGTAHETVTYLGNNQDLW